jgi:hypothetical protein
MERTQVALPRVVDLGGLSESSREAGAFVFGSWLVTRLLQMTWGALLWFLGMVPAHSIGDDFYFGVTPQIAGWRGALEGIWQRWDAIHYIQIARGGYTSSMLSAFFPAYPIVGGRLGPIFGWDTTLGLLVLSNLATLGACFVLFQIVREEFSSSVAKVAVASLLLFPTAYFLSAPYPASLSLLFVLLAYWSARHDHWGRAFLAGTAAGLTHSTVLPLVLALGWMVARAYKHERGPGRWSQLVAPAGPLVGMGVFLIWRAAAGFPPFQEVLSATWGRGVLMPWQLAGELVGTVTSESLWVSGWLNLTVTVIAILTLMWAVRRLPTAMTVYLGSAIILLLVSTTRLDGVGRYILTAFPLFIAFGLWFQSSGRKMVGLALAVGLQLYFAGLFFMWIWTG